MPLLWLKKAFNVNPKKNKMFYLLYINLISNKLISTRINLQIL